MKYFIFFTGLASTPDLVGLKCITTNEIVCQINVSCPSGKETRQKYSKMISKLKQKYSNLL